MTEDERRNDAHDTIIEYAENERTIHCLRERLRRVVSALARFGLSGDQHPAADVVRETATNIGIIRRDPREDIKAYANALEKRDRLARSLQDHGYGALVERQNPN